MGEEGQAQQNAGQKSADSAEESPTATGGASGAATASLDAAAASDIAGNLDDRAKQLTTAANRMIGLIVALLCAGALAFYYADDILVRNLSQPVERIGAIGDAVTQASSRFTSASSHIDKVRSSQSNLFELFTKLREAEAAQKAHDTGLEETIARLIALADDLAKIKDAYGKNLSAISAEEKRFIEEGKWTAFPEVAANWPTDPSTSNQEIWRLLTVYRTAPSKEKYAAIAKLAELRDKSDELFQKQRANEQSIERAAAELAEKRTAGLRSAAKLKSDITLEISRNLWPDVDAANKRLLTLGEETAATVNTMTAMNQDLIKAISLMGDIKQKFDTFSIYTGLITRFAILAILIFLVQILTTLYRYNMRLASFYKSRADSLRLLAAGDVASLGGLASILTPVGIDFGKQPQTPMEHLVDLGKAGFSTVSKSGGKTG